MRHILFCGFRLACLLAVCLLVVGGCSGADSEVAVEIVTTVYEDQSGAAFTASGEAVGEGVVCSSGVETWLGNTTVDGEPLSDQAMHDLYTAGEEYSIVVQHEYVCDDGSGTFMLDATPVIDPALEETQDAPIASATWAITGGTGSYESLSGSGDVSQESLPDRWTSIMVGTVSDG